MSQFTHYQDGLSSHTGNRSREDPIRDYARQTRARGGTDRSSPQSAAGLVEPPSLRPQHQYNRQPPPIHEDHSAANYAQRHMPRQRPAPSPLPQRDPPRQPRLANHVPPHQRLYQGAPPSQERYVSPHPTPQYRSPPALQHRHTPGPQYRPHPNSKHSSPQSIHHAPGPRHGTMPRLTQASSSRQYQPQQQQSLQSHHDPRTSDYTESNYSNYASPQPYQDARFAGFAKSPELLRQNVPQPHSQPARPSQRSSTVLSVPEESGRTDSNRSPRASIDSIISQDNEEPLEERYADAQRGLDATMRRASLGNGRKASVTATEPTVSPRSSQGLGSGLQRSYENVSPATIASSALGASLVSPSPTMRTPHATHPDNSLRSSNALASKPSHESLDDLGPPTTAGSIDKGTFLTVNGGNWSERSLSGKASSEFDGNKSSETLRALDTARLSPNPTNVPRTSRNSKRASHLAPDSPDVRQSTTSLPGLIRRALKLATAMESGKTASTWGTEWMNPQPNANAAKRTSEGSISIILNAFPVTPKGGSPQSFAGERRVSDWPQSALRNIQEMSPAPQRTCEIEPKRRRRCCGMPLWAFILTMVVLVALVAAAVIIPVVLVVVPKQSDNSGASSSTPTLGNCQASLQCANGGSAIVSANNKCICLCTNGFAGSTCQAREDTACSSISLPMVNQATVGSSLPDILSNSQSRYGVPLNASTILSLFSAANLSCTSQNALITLNGASTKRDIRRHPTIVDEVVSGHQLATRQNAASSTTYSPSSNATLDFARTSILWVFQSTHSLDNAIEAQSNLQAYLLQTTSQDPKNIVLGDQWTTNLVSHKLTASNGTVVGGS